MVTHHTLRACKVKQGLSEEERNLMKRLVYFVVNNAFKRSSYLFDIIPSNKRTMLVPNNILAKMFRISVFFLNVILTMRAMTQGIYYANI